MSEVYFREPTDGKKAFSQHFGQFLQFEKTAEDTYFLVSPDGSNEYKYENGVCTEVKVSRDYGTVYFKIKPESYASIVKTDSLSRD
jgi:L-ribulose-5-phosphate 3-epimerase UlaE